MIETTIAAIAAQRFADDVCRIIGTVTRHNGCVICHGSCGPSPERSVTADNVFEIGSITKVFTALVLAELVERQLVSFSNALQEFMPAGVHVPERAGTHITLKHLVDHTSGLPRIPSNLRPKDAADPYAEYGVAQLYEFLSGCQLSWDIGSHCEYSNLGYGLLGHVLERMTGKDYESLLRTVVLEPLGMNDTGVELTPEMRTRVVPGHDARGQPTRNWHFGVLVGAGGLKSTGRDMLTFLSANLDPPSTPLGTAMRRIRKIQSAHDHDDAMGWRTLSLDGAFSGADPHLVIVNGGTGGYSAFAGFDPSEGVGVVVLANASPAVALDVVESIGLHLLDPRYPLT